MTADDICDSEAYGRLLEEAREIFPDHNGEQADDAADWILDRLMDEFPDAPWASDLGTEVYENVYAGLT